MSSRGAKISDRAKRRFQCSRGMLLCTAFACVYFLLDWWMLSSSEVLLASGFHEQKLKLKASSMLRSSTKVAARIPAMYERLLALAAHELAENDSKEEPDDLWTEPLHQASVWRPCADFRDANHRPPEHSTGYIVVHANGGLNQQRVAICNAVAVARLLNATLVLPKFLFSNVWLDESQFGDIYQEDYFIHYLEQDVRIVKHLPVELQSLDLQAIGSFFSEADVMKEAKPSFYLEQVLPVLLRNRVVCFYGFGNRLSFDPVPFEIQRLRCRCNFHALKFIPKIRDMGELLLQRMRRKVFSKEKRFIALHLRFEIDMVAYSMCDFGGGEGEITELRAYREEHFPLLVKYHNATPSLANELRELGQCPLTPEEAVLMLAAIGFKRETPIFLAGAHIYGGQARMTPLSNLYPNLVTKEKLMSKDELAAFSNRSSQLASLDFLVCIAADVFAMTDSGSQLASLVSGFRMYYGGGKLPIIRPNKKRLVSIFAKNSTILWPDFQDRVRKTARESKRVLVRPIARSVYRHPRCKECMCSG